MEKFLILYRQTIFLFAELRNAAHPDCLSADDLRVGCYVN